MSTLKVIRKDLILTKSQLDDIYMYFDDNKHLPPVNLNFSFNNFLLEITCKKCFKNLCQFNFYLYKLGKVVNKEFVLNDKQTIDKNNFLIKVIKLNTADTNLGENIDILVKFCEENVVKDETYFKNQQLLAHSYFKDKLDIINFLDFSQKDELFQATYLFLLDEIIYYDYKDGDSQIAKTNFDRCILDNLILRFEYFGYDRDYYDKYIFEYSTIDRHLNDDYTKYDSEYILRFFILAVLRVFYDGKVTNCSYDDLYNLYMYFYDKLKEEGYYKK